MLQIAKVLKSNGTDGGILIGLTDITIEEIDLTEPVYIEFDGLPVPFFIESLTPKGGDKAFAKLTDVCSLEDAEEIVGRPISVDYLEDAGEENDFTGWEVQDKGRKVGTVTGIELIPGNPCIYIGEALVPLNENLILDIDEKKHILNIDIPEGLL